jgi:hypothetical protein
MVWQNSILVGMFFGLTFLGTALSQPAFICVPGDSIQLTITLFLTGQS